MHALGGIANEHQLPIQTHISENLAGAYGSVESLPFV